MVFGQRRRDYRRNLFKGVAIAENQVCDRSFFVYSLLALIGALHLANPQNKKPRQSLGFKSAEEEGFEPPDLLRSPVFKTGAINRSTTPLCTVHFKDCKGRRFRRSSKTTDPFISFGHSKRLFLLFRVIDKDLLNVFVVDFRGTLVVSIQFQEHNALVC
jgi:hypothetical protein